MNKIVQSEKKMFNIRVKYTRDVGNEDKLGTKINDVREFLI